MGAWSLDCGLLPYAHTVYVTVIWVRCYDHIRYVRNYNIEEIGRNDANSDWSSDEDLDWLTDWH